MAKIVYVCLCVCVCDWKSAAKSGRHFYYYYMLCYVYSALPRSFAALSLSLAHTHSLTDCPRCCCRCFTFIYIVRRVAVALLLPLLRSRRSLLTFCYFITRSLTRSHEQRAAFSRLLLYSRFFTLLYVCITLHTLRYVSLRYVLLLFVKRFLSFFISFLLVFCFYALLLISCFYFDSLTRFYCSRSVVYLCFYLSFSCSLLSLSLSFSYFCHCLLIGARAAGSGKLN